MSKARHRTDDSSTDIENYEQFTTDSGTVHYKTDDHHVAVSDDYETNYLYFNEYVDNAVDGSVYFTDVAYKKYDGRELSSRFIFSYDGQTTLSIDEDEVSIEFEELLFEVLINE